MPLAGKNNDAARKRTREYAKRRYHADPEFKASQNKQAAEWAAKHPLKSLFINKKHYAKKYGVPFTITLEDIVIPEHCPVLGIPLVLRGGPRVDGTVSLDQLRPSKGYTPGNVRVISWKANRLKNDETDPAVFRAIADYIDKELQSN